MYYFLKPKLVYWQTNILQATLLSNVSKEHELNWRSVVKLNSPLPEFVFSVPEAAPVLDNYRTGGDFYNLYSNSLIKLLDQNQVAFELYPTKVVGITTKSDLKFSHRVFRLIDVFDCLDETKTEFDIITIGKRLIKTVIKPIFTGQFLMQKKMMFRIAGYEQYIMIHADLKKKIEDANLIGCRFMSSYQQDNDTLGMTSKLDNDP